MLALFLSIIHFPMDNPSHIFTRHWPKPRSSEGLPITVLYPAHLCSWWAYWVLQNRPFPSSLQPFKASLRAKSLWGTPVFIHIEIRTNYRHEREGRGTQKWSIITQVSWEHNYRENWFGCIRKLVSLTAVSWNLRETWQLSEGHTKLPCVTSQKKSATTTKNTETLNGRGHIVYPILMVSSPWSPPQTLETRQWKRCLTTLGLYGGSIFLSYNICQSIVLKNGWLFISSYRKKYTSLA